ncbi:MAG: NUDIX hydrolase [Lachnospiraceae bacterium]|nr:NUDIX hydrolase [Lachnospiraceae bacterium]
MKNYTMTDEEIEYLKGYDITQYDRPSLTADMAVFAVLSEGDSKEYRKDPKKRLGILMIRRGTYPYRDCYGLPGGFARVDESIEETAFRELKEETSVDSAFLEPFGMFSAPTRDPRGWIVSQGFLALVDANKYKVHAGTDAWEATWFFIDVDKKEIKRRMQKDKAEIITRYTLKLERDEKKLEAVIEEHKKFCGYHETTQYEIIKDEDFAFDHAEIVLRAYLALKEQTAQSGRIVFDLMPELFTLYSLQEAHEVILGEKLLTPNFRRKMAPLVIETDEMVTGPGHRPAKLFRRNTEAFYERS